MRVLIYSEKTRAEALDILSALWAEHAGYYGRPHNLNRPHAGAVTSSVAFKAIEEAIQAEGLDGRIGLPQDCRRLHAGDYVAGGWITSADNQTFFVWFPDFERSESGVWLELRSGRRHGCRQFCTAKDWRYFETHTPDASPDAMGVGPKPDEE